MQFSQNENPQSYIDNSITYSGIIRKTDRLSNKQTLYQECRGIFQKQHESRAPSENQTLLQLVQKSELLKELSELYGMEFVKGMLRNAKMEFVEEGQVIAEQQQDIKYMVVLLEGKIGVEGTPEDTYAKGERTLSPLEQEALQNMSLKTQALFDKLTLLAKKERELQRRAMKLKRKSTLPISDYKFMLPVLSKHDYGVALQNIQRSVLMGEQFGGKQRLNGRTFKSRALALQKSTLLILQISFLFYWLQAAFKSKLNKNIEKMKTIPAFQALENQKLAEIIVSMRLVRRAKNQIIYSQGDPAEMLYLLFEGQLKVSKEADLFRQNPNTLYTDRRRLQQRGKALSRSVHEQEEQDVLPFANLTSLYNYRPTRKTIDMGLLSSFGLFGEEELVFKTKRETTVQVHSIQACYYQIQFKKVLEIIGPKQADRFKEAFQASISKKVLYRQSELAEQVHLQNQHNLNYFYLDPGATDRSPRRPKLDKINRQVDPPHTACLTPDPMTPFFTTFNFNKMISQRYSTIDKRQHTLRSTSENESTQELPRVEVSFNRMEEKVVDMAHTWDPIERKVKQEGRLSKRLSPFRHTINIQDPLIDTQFFDHVAKEQRRINKEVRNIRFSLGKRTK